MMDEVGAGDADAGEWNPGEERGDAAKLARDRYRTMSVIVPVFNERNTVAEILRRIRAVELPMQLEVVVVDDGSTDGTDKVLSVLQDSTVRVLTHRANQGKGAAVRTGINTARGSSCSSRTRTSSTTPTTGRSCSSR